MWNAACVRARLLGLSLCPRVTFGETCLRRDQRFESFLFRESQSWELLLDDQFNGGKFRIKLFESLLQALQSFLSR